MGAFRAPGPAGGLPAPGPGAREKRRPAGPCSGPCAWPCPCCWACILASLAALYIFRSSRRSSTAQVGDLSDVSVCDEWHGSKELAPHNQWPLTRATSCTLHRHACITRRGRLPGGKGLPSMEPAIAAAVMPSWENRRHGSATAAAAADPGPEAAPEQPALSFLAAAEAAEEAAGLRGPSAPGRPPKLWPWPGAKEERLRRGTGGMPGALAVPEVVGMTTTGGSC